jgi:hypothetical protein
VTPPNGVAENYSYDGGSELTGITYTLGANTLGNLTYGYDLAGRRTSLGGTLAQSELPLPVSTATYNADNQLTQWGTANLYYDANSNMTSDGTNNYVWDARNHLASMDLGQVSFSYDGFGWRVGKTVSGTTTNYLYDGANIVQELSGSTVTANLLTGLGVDECFSAPMPMARRISSPMRWGGGHARPLMLCQPRDGNSNKCVPGAQRRREILRCAQNDASGPPLGSCLKARKTNSRFLVTSPQGALLGMTARFFAFGTGMRKLGCGTRPRR